MVVVIGGAVVVVVGVQGTVVDEVGRLDVVVDGAVDVVEVGGQGIVVVVVGGSAVTLKLFALVAVSAPSFTEIFPVVAPAGTTAVICVGPSTVNFASIPLNVTVSTFSRLVPVMTTSVPIGPFVGVNLVMVGASGGMVVVVVGGPVVGGMVGGLVGGLVGGTVGGLVGGTVGTMTMTVGGGVVGGTVGGAVTGGSVVVTTGRVVVTVGAVVDASDGRVAAVEIESVLPPPVASSAIPMPTTSAAVTAPTVTQIWLRVILAPACPFVEMDSLADAAGVRVSGPATAAGGA